MDSTQPSDNDSFFTNIRRVKQSIFPCKHEWEYYDHKQFHRRCKWCGEYQMVVYHKFGNIRKEWKSYNI